MSNSEFIASLIGPVLLAISGSLLLNRDAFLEALKHLSNDMLLIFFAGITLLIAGIAIVRVHDVWTGWETIVTLMGWLAILGGLFRILFAPRMEGMVRKVADNPSLFNVSIAVSVLLGLFLTGKGFGLI